MLVVLLLPPAIHDLTSWQECKPRGAVDGGEIGKYPPLINLRYINAVIYPIYATVRPFLEKIGDDGMTVETMHQAWPKAVL